MDRVKNRAAGSFQLAQIPREPCPLRSGAYPPAALRADRWGHHEAISPSKNGLLLTAQALDEVIELFEGAIGDSQFTACGPFVENLSFQAQAAGQT